MRKSKVITIPARDPFMIILVWSNALVLMTVLVALRLIN